MAHIFTQENPKSLVGNANDVPTTIPTPDQLGSFLVTHDGAGNIGKIYAALLVANVPTWVLIGTASGGGGLAIPLNEIPFGTGPSVTSSPAFTFDPSLANILTLEDTALATVLEAGGLAGIARFLNVKDETGRDVLAVDALVGGSPKRQVVINIEGDGSLAAFFTLMADRFIRFGDGTGTFMKFDIANQVTQIIASSGDSVWEIDWGNGHPLTFATIALATASNGGVHGNGQAAYINSVLKLGDPPGIGTGALCYWSDNGPGGAGWYTGDNHIAAE